MCGHLRTGEKVRVSTFAVASYENQRPASAARQTDAPSIEVEETNDLKCPVGGAAVTLSGVAEKQAIGNGPDIWVLRTDRPFCMTVNPPVAPRQRVTLSKVEIDGHSPPIGLRIELNGTLNSRRPLPNGEFIPLLVVHSGKRLQ